MSALGRLKCKLFDGHTFTLETRFDEIGKHEAVRRCVNCGCEETAFKGPVFPGEADDPEEAVLYIKMHEPYNAPQPGDTHWEWSDETSEALRND